MTRHPVTGAVEHRTHSRRIPNLQVFSKQRAFPSLDDGGPAHSGS
jgi:hypothetical protein